LQRIAIACTIIDLSAPVPAHFSSERSSMSEKLGIGSTFPNLTVDLVGGGTISLPDDLDARYRVILFYRGHW